MKNNDYDRNIFKYGNNLLKSRLNGAILMESKYNQIDIKLTPSQTYSFDIYEKDCSKPIKNQLITVGFYFNNKTMEDYVVTLDGISGNKDDSHQFTFLGKEKKTVQHAGFLRKDSDFFSIKVQALPKKYPIFSFGFVKVNIGETNSKYSLDPESVR